MKTPAYHRNLAETCRRLAGMTYRKRAAAVVEAADEFARLADELESRCRAHPSTSSNRSNRKTSSSKSKSGHREKD